MSDDEMLELFAILTPSGKKELLAYATELLNTQNSIKAGLQDN